MVWPFSKPSPPNSRETTTTQQQPPSDFQDAPTIDEQPPKPLSRDEIAEKEFHSFLQELEADIHPSSKKYNRVPRPPPSQTTPQPTTHNESAPSPSTSQPEPLSELILPTTMSCRTAFDAAFYCNSFGGRFNDVYRYGTVRSCSEYWSDFWFCMKVRGYGDGIKREAIRDRYREKERSRYGVGRPSSEDVWKGRERMVGVGAAFVAAGDGDGLEEVVSDGEWNRRERERRRTEAEG